MSTELHFPGDEKNKQEASAEENTEATRQDVNISLPNPDRPVGPFEHSGEVAGWTKEEEKEKNDQEQQ